MQKSFSTVLVAFIALAGSVLAQTLSLTNTLSNPNPAPDEFEQPDVFGRAVAAVGGNVLVGAPGEDTGALNAGAAYLFDGNTGTLLFPIYKTAPAADEHFGTAVASVGNNLLIGAPGAGEVYLFDGATGDLLHTFSNPNPNLPNSDAFGQAVAAVGNNILIGAPGFNPGTVSPPGAVYLFEFDESSNTSALRLTLYPKAEPPFTSPFGGADQFGSAVAWIGNNMLIGAPGDDNAKGTHAGAAYLFDGSTGAHLYTFLNPSTTLTDNDQFGSSIAVAGNYILIGAPARENGSAILSGTAYLFDATTYASIREYSNPSATNFSQFSASVTAFGSNVFLVIGAPHEAPTGVSNAGQAYLYDADNTAPLQELNQNPNVNAQFGTAVAAGGGHIAVAAPEAEAGAGAVYLYLSNQNQPPVADAGADQTVACASPSDAPVTLDGSASTDPDNDPLTFTWRENGDIIAGPTTSATAEVTIGIGSHTIELTVTDEANNMATDQVMVTVECPLPHPFVLLARTRVTIDHERASAGDIHSNDKIEFRDGNPSLHTGNLTAVGDIIIKHNNTIDGDATAGKNLALDPSSTITGTATSHAAVAAYPLPAFSFDDGADNVTVPANGSLSLAPGSYHDVKVEDGGSLSLRHDGSSGEYFFHKLELRTFAILSIDVSQGPVDVNLVEKFHFERDVEFVISPAVEGNSRFVTFNVMGDKDMHIHERSNVFGNVNTPRAKLILYDEVFFRGAIAAKEIEVRKNVTCLHHDSGSSTSLAKTSTSTAGDGEESNESAAAGVKGYELQQNYPNPFSAAGTYGNPETEIRFQLAEAGHAVVKIFNVLGEEIRTLADADFAAGRHAVRWNARNDLGGRVPSGVYFYQLVTPGFTETKRMILSK